MNRCFFISDFAFTVERALGGAEKCDRCLYEDLLVNKNIGKDTEVLAISSKEINLSLLESNKQAVYLISNFMMLRPHCKQYMMDNNLRYIIIEHDHKYLKSNNPAKYKNYLADERSLQNQEFYQKAAAVMCQSTLHSEILFKNLGLNNIVNLAGNLWEDKELDLMEKLVGASPPDKRKNVWGILRSVNKNKGTSLTTTYCEKNNIPFEYLQNGDFETFARSIISKKGIVFFPAWVESFNRFLVEARMLGCKVKTSARVGCATDGYLKQSGKELIDRVRQEKKRILSTYRKLITGESVPTYTGSMPRVSIITTFVDAEEYIEGYMKSVVEQTIFDQIDLYMYDAGSVGKEAEIIDEYAKKYPNIFHIRDENKIGSSEAFNKMIEDSPNELIGMIMMDDRPAPDYAEKLRKHLTYSDCDLVYGDCVIARDKNQIIDGSFYKSNDLYEHSANDFTPENMIKCLPGPMPMFRKSMISKNGDFNLTYQHANDWELWLRCVRGGSKFKKVDFRAGLYYFNPDGVTTSEDHFDSKIKEEYKIFTEYRDVIGEDNYNLYKEYFSQGA